jgi:putative endonuclease
VYFVYVLLCGDGTLYTGITNDLVRRFDQHQKGTGGHYTRARGVKRMVYSEQAANRSAALVREAAIKKLSRSKKLMLVRSKGKQ